MIQFNVGDVVILKSGGPAMTVHDVADYSPMGPNPGLHCVWFDNLKKVDDVFDPRAVELYDLAG